MCGTGAGEYGGDLRKIYFVKPGYSPFPERTDRYYPKENTAGDVFRSSTKDNGLCGYELSRKDLSGRNIPGGTLEPHLCFRCLQEGDRKKIKRSYPGCETESFPWPSAGWNGIRPVYCKTMRIF